MSSGTDVGNRPEGERLFTVTANFTAEPLSDTLRFWIELLSLGPARISFSGYNQVFQELAAPNSSLSSGSAGINFLLIRIEDWARDQSEELRSRTLQDAAQEFTESLSVFAGRARRPTILLLCPPSPQALHQPGLGKVVYALADQIQRAATTLRGVTVVSAEELATLYPVREVADAESDRHGHIPFTRAFWVSAGTMLMRKARAILHPPRKVIAVDADNTLWGGIVGEAGADRVQISGVWGEFQKFLKKLKDDGLLLVLASKNQEADVAEVFRNPGLILRREDFVAWKVNWKPKSENLRAVASELGLALDSFVFIDDNPMECAEVSAHCPTVTVLTLPSKPEAIASFLQHVWVFDLPSSTAIDKNRTEQYRDQSERKQMKNSVGSYREFIEKLELRVEIAPPTPEQFERAAQLTQRTNQFNATNVRRTTSEFASLISSGERQSLVVRVQDRFGDYGDVGLGVYWMTGDELNVDNFLLSCRVLGKGVEHRMLNELGHIADEHGKKFVVIPFRRTERNEPAAKFFESVGRGFDDAGSYRFPASHLRTVTFDPNAASEELTENESPVSANGKSNHMNCEFDEIAHGLATVPDIQRAIQAKFRRARPELEVPFVSPRNADEQAMAEIWEDTLGLDRVGVRDNFFDLGGDSVLSIQIIARAGESGFQCSLRQVFDSPTIAELVSFAPRGTSRGEPAPVIAADVPTPEFSLSKLSQKSLNQILENLARGRR